MTAHLCVGGPYDGLSYAADSYYFVAAKLLRPMPITPDMSQEVEVTVSRTEYRQQHVRANGRTFTVWAPSDQSQDKTMEMLIDGYRKPK